MERSQFTFYASFRKAAAHIKKKADRCDFYDAISDYALYGVEFDPSQYPDSVAVALELVKPNLDSSKKKAESGKRGGSDKQTGSKSEANGLVQIGALKNDGWANITGFSDSFRVGEPGVEIEIIESEVNADA